jgi:hypothetical protein
MFWACGGDVRRGLWPMPESRPVARNLQFAMSEQENKSKEQEADSKEQ